MTGDKLPSFFTKVLLPMADPDDARETCELALPLIRSKNAETVALFIVLIKKPTIAQQEIIAKETLPIIGEEFRKHGVPITTKTDYSKDLVKAMIEEGQKEKADTIIIRPRIASHLTKFFAGNVLEKLVEKSQIPLVILPHKK